MEFLHASANGFLVIMTLEYAEWTMLLGCTEVACVRDFLLSTPWPFRANIPLATHVVWKTLATVLYTRCYSSPHILPTYSHPPMLCPTPSLIKRGYLFNMTEHEMVLGKGGSGEILLCKLALDFWKKLLAVAVSSLWKKYHKFPQCPSYCHPLIKK